MFFGVNVVIILAFHQDSFPTVNRELVCVLNGRVYLFIYVLFVYCAILSRLMLSLTVELLKTAVHDKRVAFNPPFVSVNIIYV